MTTVKENNIYLFLSLDDLVPKDHLLRKVDGIVDFDFIYKLVEPLYNEDEGRPSLDPVILIKLPLIQYLFGIKYETNHQRNTSK